jgi:hypothetical protein
VRDEDNMLDCTHVTCVCVYVMGAGVLDKLVRSRLCERVCVSDIYVYDYVSCAIKRYVWVLVS